MTLYCPIKLQPRHPELDSGSMVDAVIDYICSPTSTPEILNQVQDDVMGFFMGLQIKAKFIEVIRVAAALFVAASHPIDITIEQHCT